MILITHDLGVVAEICDKVAIMYAGEIIEYGDAGGHLRQHRTTPTPSACSAPSPTSSKDVDRLEPIPGLMPDPTNLAPGLQFLPALPLCHGAACCETTPPPDGGGHARTTWSNACLHEGQED